MSLFFISHVSLQVHTWSMDVNQFVADEDEGSYSCRISGKLSLTLLKSNSYAYIVRDKIWRSYAYICICKIHEYVTKQLLHHRNTFVGGSSQLFW